MTTNTWTIADWKVAVVRHWQLKQEMQAADKNALWSYHLPEVADTESKIAECEQQLGERLHPHFRNFLLVAGGWVAFWQDVAILGAADLPRLSSVQQERVARLSSNGLLDSRRWLPIAFDEYSDAIFAIGRERSEVYGEVVWISKAEVDRYATFQEFFLAMYEYAKRDLNDLVGRPVGRPVPG